MKHKICNYIEKYGGSYIEQSTDTRSHYYILCCRKIRISDHISKTTSNIEYQLIILNDFQYLLYHVPTGTVYSCDYKEIKNWIRCFKYFTAYGSQNQDGVVKDTRTVLGISIDKFSKAQVQQIESFIKQISNKR
jgi:hypothetical protein